jgi:hypothetical protein
LAPCKAIGCLAVVLTGAERCVPFITATLGGCVSMGWKEATTFRNDVNILLICEFDSRLTSFDWEFSLKELRVMQERRGSIFRDLVLFERSHNGQSS